MLMKLQLGSFMDGEIANSLTWRVGGFSGPVTSFTPESKQTPASPSEVRITCDKLL